MSEYYAELQKKARGGDVGAQKELAYFYLEKQNRKRSYLKSQAFDYFRMAASTDDPESQYLIGFLYLNGIGRNENNHIAKQWFEKARNSGLTHVPVTLIKLFDGSNAKFPDGFETDNNISGQVIETPSEGSNDNQDDEDDTPKAPLSFRDIAFKQDEDGNYYADVVTVDCNRDDTYHYDDSDGHYSSNSYQGDNRYADSYLYDGSSLTVHDINTDLDPFDKLDALIALGGVKAQILRTQKRMKFDTLRSNKNLKTSVSSNHFVFSGNPGTGKNEIARILGHLLFDIGLLKKGHVVEVDHGDLTGAWVGHSALKTKAAIERAKGGILFIDEAYALYDHSGWGFGEEVISTLMKAMEDDRGDFIVVMAGYKDEMKYLLKSNPGMMSRFRHHIDFVDYDAKEMVDIFKLFVREEEYKLQKDAKTALLNLMKAVVKREDKFSGNGRFVRNAFERTIENMASRVTFKDKPTKRDLQTIHFSDIPSLDDVLGNASPPNYNGDGDVVKF
ncbi:MAG: AAA family ATPase [Bdellovibrionales bacterium]